MRVTARAADLPEAIEVDLSAIVELHGAIHVSDLPESATYKVLDPPEEVLAMVQPPKEEVEAVEEGARRPRCTSRCRRSCRRARGVRRRCPESA